MPPEPPSPSSPLRGDLDHARTGAVHGADAYRAVRSAVRRHGEILRLGNRFVRADSVREIAFLALGRAAVSGAYALGDALGDALTRGYLAGPDPVPEAIPFLHLAVRSDAVGNADAEAVVAAARELSGELKGRDLLVVLLTPGALGLLATPPAGVGADAYRAALGGIRRAGASADELELVVRGTADGLVAGRLLEGIADGVRVLPLVVGRGGPPGTIGGGPTRPVTPAERAAVATVLGRFDGPAGRDLRAALDRSARTDRPPVRPVQIAGPAEALQGAGDALSERRWWSRLAELTLPGGPEAAAAQFVDRIDAVLREVPRSRDRRRGVAIFAGAPLDCPDGAGEVAAVDGVLEALRRVGRRRELTYAAFRTSGARPTDGAPGAGLLRDGTVTLGPIGPGATDRPGIADVGPVLVALRPEPDA